MARKNKYGWLAFDQPRGRQSRKSVDLLDDKVKHRDNTDTVNKNK